MDHEDSALRGTRLVIAPLTETNWHSWQPNMKAVLMRRRLWAIVSGTEARPPASAPRNELRDWAQADSEAFGEIYLHISDLYKHLVENALSSADAWVTLQGHFGSGSSGSARLDLKQTLYNMEMTDDESFDRLEAAPHFDSLGKCVPRSLGETITVLREADQRRRVSAPDTTALLAHERECRRKSQRDRERGACYTCGGRGHLATSCPSAPRTTRNEHNTWRRDRNRGSTAHSHAAFGDTDQGTAAAARDSNSDLSDVDISVFALALFEGGTGSSPDDDKKTAWMLDSCCSQHITNDVSRLTNLVPCHHEIRLGNDEIVTALQKGSARISLVGCDVVVSDVLLIPRMACNLLSVGKLSRKGVNFTFTGPDCRLRSTTGLNIGTAVRTVNNLYHLQTRASRPTPDRDTACAALHADNNFLLWHNRFGHMGKDYLRQALSGGAITLDTQAARAAVGRISDYH